MTPSHALTHTYLQVTVEYGADLHTSQHGSGFPTSHRHGHVAGVSEGAEREEEEEGEEDYLRSGWNLNNISNLKGSILRYISADISGMKVREGTLQSKAKTNEFTYRCLFL